MWHSVWFRVASIGAKLVKRREKKLSNFVLLSESEALSNPDFEGVFLPEF
jgi:hypothetical protein